MAKLYFRYSAMNSGKTTQVLQVAYNYEQRNMKVLIMKPKMDTKGNDMIVSRLGIKRKVDHLIEDGENLYKYVKQQKEVYCILIDEAQFLESKQVDELMHVVVKLSIPVICYGLRSDFQTKGFRGSTRLLEIAHTIEEVKTICLCGRKALFNARKIDGKFSFSGEQVVIDNNERTEYVSLCPHCYYEKLEKYLNFKNKTN